MKKITMLLSLFISMSASAAQHFKTASAVPTQELVSELQKIYNNEIKDKKIISILVEGHTDQRASDAYNQKLSEARAKAATKVLIDMGAEKTKITSVGKGESELLTTGTTAEEYAKNRRVVVVVKSDTGTKITVISEANDTKCEEKVKIVEKVVEAKKKNMIIGGIANDYTGLDTSVSGNAAAIKSRKGAVLDIGYMRKDILDSNFGLGGSINTNGILRGFVGYEF
jgi:hypothetical protein